MPFSNKTINLKIKTIHRTKTKRKRKLLENNIDNGKKSGVSYVYCIYNVY